MTACVGAAGITGEETSFLAAEEELMAAAWIRLIQGRRPGGGRGARGSRREDFCALEEGALGGERSAP